MLGRGGGTRGTCPGWGAVLPGNLFFCAHTVSCQLPGGILLVESTVRTPVRAVCGCAHTWANHVGDVTCTHPCAHLPRTKLAAPPLGLAAILQSNKTRQGGRTAHDAQHHVTRPRAHETHVRFVVRTLQSNRAFIDELKGSKRNCHEIISTAAQVRHVRPRVGDRVVGLHRGYALVSVLPAKDI